MGGLAMRKPFALCVAAAMLAALSAEAAYRKGELLWKCDFTQAEAEKYGVARYKLSKSGLGMAYLPKDGKAGDGAMFFKTQSEKQTAMATIAPDVRFTGVVQVEAVVKGVEIGQGPQHYTGPKVMFPFVPKPGARKTFPEVPKELGTYDWKTLIKVQGIPDTAEGFVFVLGLELAPGEFWVDSLRVYRAEEVPDGEVGTPPENEAAKRIPRGPYAKAPRQGGWRGVMSGNDMGDASIANLADVWGANLVRIQIGGRDMRDAETMDDWFAVLDKKLEWVQEVMDRCRRHGVKAIIDLHAGPKCKATKHASNVLPADYDTADLRKAWRVIATRFKDHPATYAYDILNEPSVAPETWKRVCLEVMADVRKIDAKTPFMMESVKHWYEGENVIYSPHFYSPHTLTHFGVGGGSNQIRWSYPGYIDGVYWDKEQMRVALKQYIDFQTAHPGARFCVGEFSCILWSKGADKWIRDAIGIFEEYGWDWCYHAYREWPPWSVECEHDADYTVGKWSKATGDTDRKRVLLEGLSLNRRIAAAVALSAASPLEYATVKTTFANGKSETSRVRLVRQKDGAWRYELRTIDMPADATGVELTSDAAVRREGDPGWWMVDDGRWGTFTHNVDGSVVSHGRMPFFGMKTAEGKAWFAIVKGMRYETTDRVLSSKGVYRMFAFLKLNSVGFNPYENWTIDFYELNGDDATYSGMGRLYRKWQLDRGEVKPLRERVKRNEALAYAADSFFVRCKFGRCDRTKTTQEDWLKAMPPVLVEHTFEDFKDIMRRFKEIGIDKAEMCMVGFQQGGHDGPFPDLFPADERFGGEKGMRDAIAYGKSLGYRMNCHINQNNFYRNAKRWNLADVAKDSDGSPQKYTVYPGGQVYRSCWEVCCNKYVDKDIADEKDLGLNGLFHVDVTSAILPSVCHDPMHPNNRKSMREWQLKVGEKVRAAFGGYSSECGIDHCAPILDNALYVSTYPGWHSPKRDLVDGYFPIWHVVYSGIILSQPFYATLDAPCPRGTGSGKTDAVRGSEKVTTFLDTPARRTLKVFELNGRPMFYYTDYKDLEPIKRMYDLWQPLKHLQFEFMEDHAEIAPDVIRVRYSNGEEVVCNYNAAPFAYRGQSVMPMAYRLYGKEM